jgi:hypothetical protein
MPYAIRPRGDGAYEVVNTATGKVHAAHTSKTKAERQVRLLHMVEHGGKATGKPASRRFDG